MHGGVSDGGVSDGGVSNGGVSDGGVSDGDGVFTPELFSSPELEHAEERRQGGLTLYCCKGKNRWAPYFEAREYRIKNFQESISWTAPQLIVW